MATAPNPGAAKRQAAQRTAIKITVGDDEYILHTGDFGPQDSLDCRKATGFPIDAFFNGERFGMDGVVAIIWLARRKAGERNLTYQQVMKGFPTFDSFDGIEVEEITDDVEDGSPS